MTEKKVSFWRIFWASLSATALVSIIGWVIALFIIGGLFEEEPERADKKVLHLTLSGKIGESSSSRINGLALSVDRTTGLSDLLYGFERAAEDKGVKGIFLDLEMVDCGYATARELRNAIKKFRKSGKFVVAYLSGELVTQKQYYISSAANEVYGFPTSAMQFIGLGSEYMYFKNTFDKIGLEMQVVRGSNNDFKSAVEPYFRENMSDSSRLQTKRYLTDMWDKIRSEIADDRKVKADELYAIAEEAKIQRVEDALKYKLVDGLKYRDEVVNIVRKKAGGNPDMTHLLAFEKYARREFKKDQMPVQRDGAQPNMAVILAEGAISVNGTEMTSRDICAYFQEVRAMSSIKTVVFRINSPGGSALASEEIWREVMLTAKAKKVIVSMGDVAASGGYYIATPATTIFAEPTTITGSIGVFGVIPYTGKMFNEKLGLTFDRVQTNKHAVFSTNQKLTEEEMQLLQREVDEIYGQFKDRVATGRGMTKAQVERLARGRVWTGSDALHHGLVDKLGGLSDAIAYAQKKAGISKPVICYWPKIKESTFDKLLEDWGDNDARVKVTQTKLPAVVTDSYEQLQKLEEITGIQMRLPFQLVVN